MKHLLFVILCATLCYGQSKPPVIPPKTEIVAHWFNTQAPVDPELQLMLDHPSAVFSVMHDEDQMYCTHGPSDSWRFPEVRRCDGAI